MSGRLHLNSKTITLPEAFPITQPKMKKADGMHYKIPENELAKIF